MRLADQALLLFRSGRKKETNDEKRKRKASNKEIQGMLNWVGLKASLCTVLK